MVAVFISETMTSSEPVVVTEGVVGFGVLAWLLSAWHDPSTLHVPPSYSSYEAYKV
jgi:hypothetical protein